MNADFVTSHLTGIITAIGGLGTAAFGLLEACKPVIPWINHIGFGGIRRTTAALAPGDANAKSPLNALPRNEILRALLANWVNGVDLARACFINRFGLKLSTYA